MREYSTQMEAARKGIVTKELEIVAKKERMTVEELMPLVAEGKVAICANKNHKCIDPEGVGSMLKTKINVNLGISRDCKDYDIEMEKVMQAVNMVAHAIGPFVARQHNSFPQKAHKRMSGNDWYCTCLRFRYSLSA